MKKEIKKFRFAYSGNTFEGTKEFSLISEVRKFLKTVPEYDLKNSVVIKNNKGISYIGAYVKDKRMILF